MRCKRKGELPKQTEFSFLLLGKLKQLQLLSGRIGKLWLGAVIQFDVAKLFVGDADDADISELWQKRFHTFFVYFGVFHTGAMANVDGKLKHRKTVFDEVFPKQGVGFLVLFRFSRQIE